VPDQAKKQQPAEKHIKCHAKSRPPSRYAGVLNDETMDEVKESVPNEGGSHEPEVPLISDYGDQQESACDDDFND
jgi:hypothetical protein